MVNGECIITVYITEKSEEQCTGERPWLTLVVAQVSDLQTDFFHDFPMDGFFNGFADLCESGDQSMKLEISSLIFREEKFISIGDAYDNCGHQNRIFMTATGRAEHHSLLCVVLHRCSAAAAESTALVPLKNLVSGDAGKGKMTRRGGAEFPYAVQFIIVSQADIQIWNQIKMIVIYRKQVNIILIKRRKLSFQLPKTQKGNFRFRTGLMKQYFLIFKGKNKAVCRWWNRLVFIVVNMWCDILYHNKTPPENTFVFFYFKRNKSLKD